MLRRCSSVSRESETDDIADAERDVSSSSSALGFQLLPPGTVFDFICLIHTVSLNLTVIYLTVVYIIWF